MVDTPEEAEQRRALARETFHEVLDSIKHHDDKIGRFITGISFLTAGAIGFGFRNEILAIRYSIGSSSVPLPAILFTAFLLLVLLGVLLLIMGLGPDIELPTRSPTGSELDRTRLFFLYIAGYTSAGWQDRWSEAVPVDTLRRDLTRDYVLESRSLAQKADFKQLRTNEARGVVCLAVLSLALGLVLTINAWAGVHVRSGALDLSAIQSVPWDRRPKLLAAIVIAVFVLVLGYDIYRQAQKVETRFAPMEAGYVWRLLAAIVVLAAFPFLVLLSPSGGLHVVRLAGFCVPPAVAGLLRDRYKARTARVVLLILGSALSFAVLATFRWELPQWQLALACGAAVIVGVPRLLTAFETWHNQKEGADRLLDALLRELVPGAGSRAERTAGLVEALRQHQGSVAPPSADDHAADLAIAIAEFARGRGIDREAWVGLGVSDVLLDRAGIDVSAARTGPAGAGGARSG